MNITDLAMKIVEIAVGVTVFVSVFLVLYITWVYMFDAAATFILRSFKSYHAFIEFILDKNKYNRKLKEIENQSLKNKQH